MIGDTAGVLLALLLAALAWLAVQDAIKYWRMTPDQRAERRKRNRIVAEMLRVNGRWGPRIRPSSVRTVRPRGASG